MSAVENNPAFAKKVGVPQSVGKDFSTADKGRKFSKGGDMASKMNPGFMAMMAKKKSAGPSAMGKPVMKKGMDTAKDGMKKMASGGLTGALAKHAAKPASKAHAGLKAGGMPMVMKEGKKVPAFAADGEGKMKKGGMTKMGAVKTSSKPDGIVVKGKTKGTMIKMKSGGRAC
jgi:hypothetical protein